MSGELEYRPPFELWKINHGIDGWDAKSWLVARFTDRQKAIDYLTARGFTYSDGRDVYSHSEIQNRNTMGKISYQIKSVVPEVPVDPK